MYAWICATFYMRHGSDFDFEACFTVSSERGRGQTDLISKAQGVAEMWVCLCGRFSAAFPPAAALWPAAPLHGT